MGFRWFFPQNQAYATKVCLSLLQSSSHFYRVSSILLLFAKTIISMWFIFGYNVCDICEIGTLYLCQSKSMLTLTSLLNLFQNMPLSHVIIAFLEVLQSQFLKRRKKKTSFVLANFMLPYVEFLFVILPFNSQRNKNMFLKLEFKKVVPLSSY